MEAETLRCRFMSRLKDYAAYLLAKRLEELTRLKLEQLYELNPPLIKKYEGEQLRLAVLVETSTRQFLEAVVAGREYEQLTLRNKDWKHDMLHGIDTRSVSLMDIVMLSAADEIAMSRILPDFTKKSKEAVFIIEELQQYHTKVHELAAATIDKRQQAEQEKTRESEERFKDIFDNASDLIHIADPSGKLLYANKSWLETLGFSESELPDITIYDVVAEREKDRFRAYRDRIISGLPALEALNTVFISRNGKEVAIEGHMTCKVRDGKAEYTRSILRDVTLRQAAEQQIRFYTAQLVEREENIRQIIRNAPDAIIVIDTESRVKLWNPKAETMFGWSAMDVVGRDLAELIIPPVHRQSHREGIRRHLETGEERVLNRTIETQALDASGQEFYISLTISKTTQGGEPVFIAFIRDISDIKRSALELERKQAELERSNKELEQFAWLASHDLKEPLRKIHTFSDLLMRQGSGLPEGTLGYLEKIQHSARRMTDLIEDILSYSNVSSDAEEFVSADLNAILQDVLIDMEVSIKLSGAGIVADKLPIAEVLPFQMRQLFQNLISNSIKYAKPGLPPLIQVLAKEKAPGILQIQVKDNGIGFKKEFAEKVFQIFQRLVPKNEYEGTGIGLALCRKIVENHHGSITAESEEGKGTTFTIQLPLKHPSDLSPGFSGA